MRLNDLNLTDPASAAASRPAESQRIQVDTSAHSGFSGGPSGDRVDLSGLAGRISQALQSLSSQTAQRAGQLEKDFRAGRYQPDAPQIAAAMVRF